MTKSCFHSRRVYGEMSICSLKDSMMQRKPSLLQMSSSFISQDSEMALLLTLCFLVTYIVHAVHAADPDPLQDFCVADTSASPQPNGFLCRDSKSVSGKEFASENLRNISINTSPGGFTATLVTASTFPALNTLGLAIARADLGPGGSVPLHVHPRATELIYIELGIVEAGFVDGNNTLFSRILHKGDLFVIPRGLLHYQHNIGSGPASGIAVFNSQDPGVQVVGPSVFGANIPDAVLTSSLQLNQSTIDALRGLFTPSS